MVRPLDIKIAPTVLIWARETAGLSVEEAAARTGVSIQKLSEWELGKSNPTYHQLETLAYNTYKRPLAVFFRPSPPEAHSVEHEFRNLPGSVAKNLSSATRLIIRRARHLQNLAKTLSDESVEKFAEFTIKNTDKPKAVAERFRQFVNLPIDEQKKWTADKAFSHFREYVESTGIIVFLFDMPLEEARAFSLYDPVAPVVVINKQDAKNGQTFSLFHEVCHILLQVSGIFSSRFEGLSTKQRKIEEFCDQFSAAFLIPDSDFKLGLQLAANRQFSDSFFEDLAQIYKVSKEVILRKLVDLKKAPPDYYFTKKREWDLLAIAARNRRKEIQRESGASGGSQPPDSKVVSEKGKTYVNRVLDSFNQGKITYKDISDYLEVKLDHLPKIIDRIQ